MNYQKVVGVDLGLSTFAICSDGKEYNYDIEKLNKLIKKANFYKSQLTRRKSKTSCTQSNNYYKTKRKYEEVNKKIRNIRFDFIHKTAHELVFNYDIIVVEKMKTTILASKKRGMGKNFNRNMFNFCFSTFTSFLTNSAKNHGKLCKVVEPSKIAATQLCSNCNSKKIKSEKLTLKDRVYRCSNCGLTIDRDSNAAFNLYNYGITLLKQ